MSLPACTPGASSSGARETRSIVTSRAGGTEEAVDAVRHRRADGAGGSKLSPNEGHWFESSPRALCESRPEAASHCGVRHEAAHGRVLQVGEGPPPPPPPPPSSVGQPDAGAGMMSPCLRCPSARSSRP